MELIVYDGWPFAVTGADEVHLHSALLELAELEEGHALVRYAFALAMHAFEVATWLEQGPFDQGRAERFRLGAVDARRGIPARRRRGRCRTG